MKTIPPLSTRATKRVFDLLLVAILFPVVAPVSAAVAAVLRFADGSPIFFRQDRVGRGGRVFSICKFRTMVTNADEYVDPETGMPTQSRITKVGGLLRRVGLDELPQMWNVARGEMSIVGPRPMLDDQRTRHLLEAGHPRFTVKPGITGLAQVRGRNTLPWSQRLILDEDYVATTSPWTDIKILLLTVNSIIRPSHFRPDQAPADVDDLSRSASR